MVQSLTCLSDRMRVAQRIVRFTTHPSQGKDARDREVAENQDQRVLIDGLQ